MYAYQKRLYWFFIIFNFAVLQNIIKISCAPRDIGSQELGSDEAYIGDKGVDPFAQTYAIPDNFDYDDGPDFGRYFGRYKEQLAAMADAERNLHEGIKKFSNEDKYVDYPINPNNKIEYKDADKKADNELIRQNMDEDKVNSMFQNLGDSDSDLLRMALGNTYRYGYDPAPYGQNVNSAGAVLARSINNDYTGLWTPVAAICAFLFVCGSFIKKYFIKPNIIDTIENIEAPETVEAPKTVKASKNKVKQTSNRA